MDKLSSKQKSLIERIIGYPILREKVKEVTTKYLWVVPEKGPWYMVDKDFAMNGLTLTREGAFSPDHSIPEEVFYYISKGYEPMVYPCPMCLDRSEKHRFRHGYSLPYGMLIVIEDKQQRRQYCTNPDCMNNIVEWFGSEKEDG